MFQKSIAAVAAALAVAAFAPAQTGGTGSDDNQLVDFSGVSVRLALGVPYDETLRRTVGSTLLGVGVEFQPTRSLLRDSETYFAAEMFLRGLDTSKGFVAPLTINQRFYNTRTVAANVRRSYGFIGAGFAFVDRPSGSSNGSSNATLCLRGGVGSEIGERLFFEAGVLFGGNDNGVRPGLVSISGGYRF